MGHAWLGWGAAIRLLGFCLPAALVNAYYSTKWRALPVHAPTLLSRQTHIGVHIERLKSDGGLGMFARDSRWLGYNGTASVGYRYRRKAGLPIRTANGKGTSTLYTTFISSLSEPRR